MKFSLPPIYPITDKDLAKRPTHLSIIKELVRGGATLVQVRDKFTPPRELLLDLQRCVEFALSKGIALIVNDRCDLALSSNAMGVHLGQEDLPAEAARAILGRKKIIGLSTNTLVQVKQAASLPIQYIGFGPIYATSTKGNLPPALGLHGLARASRASRLPIVAIGGIGLGQVREILDAGAASAAVISALMTSSNLSREMERILKEARRK